MQTTAQLATCAVNAFVNGHSQNPQTKHEQCLMAAMNKLSRHRDQWFRSCVQDLRHNNNDVLPETLQKEIGILVEDGGLKWGTVVSVFTLAGYVGNTCDLRDDEARADYRRQLAAALSESVTSRMGSWISQNGGWDGMIDFYTHLQPQDPVFWSTVLLGAGLAVFIGVRAFKILAH